MGSGLVVHTSSGRTRRRRLAVSLCVGAIVLLALVASLASLALATTPSFPDVATSHPYYAAITDLASRSIINGKTDGKFWPDDPVTRQQFAKMIVLTGAYPVSESDICLFTDVTTGDASTFFPDNFIAVCAAHGITTGKTATTFDPTGKITRLQMVTMAVRMADDLHPGLLVAPPSTWTGNVAWTGNATHGANAARAEYNGLLVGLDLVALSPTGDMSRGEVAQVLHNLVGKVSSITTTSESTTSSSTTTTELAATTTTTQATGSTVTRVPVGQEYTASFRMLTSDGAPLGGMLVQWSMEGVGFFVADDAGDISDENVASNNRDNDMTDANGRATVRAKSYVAGRQIIKLSYRVLSSGGSSGVRYTVATLEWY